MYPESSQKNLKYKMEHFATKVNCFNQLQVAPSYTFTGVLDTPLTITMNCSFLSLTNVLVAGSALKYVSHKNPYNHGCRLDMTIKMAFLLISVWQSLSRLLLFGMLITENVRTLFRML